MLRLLHTADWHLGRRFPSFPEEGQKKLSRARMDVVARILDVARRNAVNAVLCVGDIFDDPEPGPGLLGRACKDVPRARGPASACLSGSWQPRPPDAGVGLGSRVTPFEHGFPRGCTSSTAMISCMRSRPKRFYTRGRADRRQGRTIWRWRFRRASLATNGSESVACTAAHLTLRGIRRTFLFAGMQACSEGWIISR